MSTAELTAAITQLLSNPKNPDPFGSVAKLLVTTFNPNVGPEHAVGQLYAIWVGLAFTLIIAGAAAGIRWRRAHRAGGRVVFIVKQEGFLIPGAAILFLIGMAFWAVISMVYVWKVWDIFQNGAGQQGMQELRSFTWITLQVTAALMMWGFVGSANLSPSVTRPVGGKNGTMRSYLWVGPQTFNRIVKIVPVVYLASLGAAVIGVSVRCEELFTTFGTTIGTAITFSELGISPANQTALLQFEGNLARLANQVGECKQACAAEFALWGVYTILNGSGMLLGTYVMLRKIKGQIRVLERAAGDLRRARQTGNVLERHNSRPLSQWSRGHESDFDRESKELFPAYGGNWEHGTAQHTNDTDSHSVFSGTSKGSLGSGAGAAASSMLRAGGERIRTGVLGPKPPPPEEQDELWNHERRIAGLREAKNNLILQLGCFLLAGLNYILVCFIGIGYGVRAVTDPVIVVLVTTWAFWVSLACGLPMIGAIFIKAFHHDPSTQGGILGNPVLAPPSQRAPSARVAVDPAAAELRRMQAAETRDRLEEEARFGAFSPGGGSLTKFSSPPLSTQDHGSVDAHKRQSSGSEVAFRYALDSSSPRPMPASIPPVPPVPSAHMPPGYSSSTAPQVPSGLSNSVSSTESALSAPRSGAFARPPPPPPPAYGQYSSAFSVLGSAGGIDQSPRAPQPSRQAGRPTFLNPHRRSLSGTSGSSGGGGSSSYHTGQSPATSNPPMSQAHMHMGPIPSSRSTSNYSDWPGARR